MANVKQAFSIINVEDATRIIQDSTNNMQDFSPKQKNIVITNISKDNEVAFGYLYVNGKTDDAHVLNVLQCRDNKDVHYVHLIEWFELDFIYYVKKEKKIIVFGDSVNKVEDAIIFIDDRVKQ